jgi:hypothetical protein
MSMSMSKSCFDIRTRMIEVSSQCTEVKDMAFDTCCFNRCSLCGEGSRLDPDVLVEIDDEEGSEGEEGSKQGKCSDIESNLFQVKTTDGSEECNEARSLHYDSCCFKIVSEEGCPSLSCK